MPVKTVSHWAEEALKFVNSKFTSFSSTSSYNHSKVLDAFCDADVSDFHFHGSTGYGYGDSGREKLDELYARVFKAEAAVVRTQFVSGTHTIVRALFGIARPGDEVVAAVGRPYDTLNRAIGAQGGNGSGTLAEWGIGYREVSWKDDGKPDLDKLGASISPKTKVVLIQRSRGYQLRQSVSVEEIGKMVALVKRINPGTVCLVDNCYGEFVEKREPTEVGADLTAGSLIKNPGGGIAPSGGYIVGRRDLIAEVGHSYSAPGLGAQIGATLCDPRILFQGLFMAPLVVAESLKGAVFTARLFELLGIETSPTSDACRTDIVQGVKLGNKEMIKAFCRYFQAASPVDSMVTPEASMLPGYADPVIMAAGTFVQGSSIELSADAPLREPYWLFIQGGLSFEYTRLTITRAVEKMAADGELKIP